VEGFWATPSFALAKTFGAKGGVVECYLDVKRALTFNMDAVGYFRKEVLAEALEKAGISLSSLKDSRYPEDVLQYYFLTGLDVNGKPYADPARGGGLVQLYGFIDECWDLIKRSGYDGVCFPEQSVPTVGAMDFSQVTIGKRVKAGDDARGWDRYDVTPLGDAGAASPPVLESPAKREVPVLTPPSKPVSVPKSPVHLTAPASKPVKPVPKSPSKPAPKPVKPVPKSATPDGSDPRFKEGELFASRSFLGFPVSPLFSGGVRSRIVSGPDTDSYGGGVRDNDLIGRVKVFSRDLLKFVREFYPPVVIDVSFSPVGDSVSYKASLTVHLGRVLFKDCFSVQGVVNSGKYFVRVFSGKPFLITLKGLNSDLVARVVERIKSKGISEGVLSEGVENNLQH
jgi:hypothetical protein